MIFTKADRERLETIATALGWLRLDIGLRTSDKDANLHNRMGSALALLNELGAAVGRIENQSKARAESETMRYLWLQGFLEGFQKAVNRRADESRDVVRGLQSRVENLHSSPLTPLGEALAALPDLLKTRLDMTNNAIVALSGRLSNIELKLSELAQFAYGPIATMQDVMKANRKLLAARFGQRKARRKKK